MSGPHEPTKSTYTRPSTSHRRAPSPRAMNGGAPPTARNARTGLFTPPGITRLAALSRRSDSLIPGLHRDLHTREVDAVPPEGGHRVHAAADDRRHDVEGRWIRRLAADQRLAAVGLREVGAGIDVRVVDHRHREPVALELADAQQVLGIDVVRRARIPRVALGIARVQLVLGVAAAQQAPLAAAGQDDAAGLERVLFDR